ncbi:ABC transporter ATP-binding protein/permease [Clostridium perfringens]
MIDKRLLNLCKESKKYIGLTVLMNWISVICNLMTIIVIGFSIQEFFSLGNIENLNKKILILAALLGVRFCVNLLSGHFSYKSSEMVKITLRDKIYEKLLKLGMRYDKVDSTSSIVQMAVEGVEALEVYFSKYLPQLIYSILAPLTLFCALAFISFKAALVFILCLPLIPISIILIMKIAKKILKEYWGQYSDLGNTFLENLQGLTTLKVFDVDNERHELMNEEAESFRKITMKVLSMQLNSINVMDLIAFGGAALGSIVALLQFRAGTVSLGGMIVILLISAEFFIPLRLLGSYFHIAMNGIAAADRIFKVLEADESKVSSDSNLNEISNISLCNVSFSYDGKREVLKDISLSINKGDYVAIVGESGSGKSTIASLILNNYKASKGKITLNGADINNIDFSKLYNRVSIISTNSYIFNGTIKDNLLIAKKNATLEEINYALKKANLLDFVNSKKEKLDLEVGEGGSKLSGGQKQRLALARTILANREVIIFDEATSNIDVESENMIWKSINEISKEKTVIVISHRLANVKNADRIYMLDKGILVEEGSHKDLMERKNKYYGMVNYQNELEIGGVI